MKKISKNNILILPTIMDFNTYKVASLLVEQYNCNINTEILNEIISDIFDSSGSVKDSNKLLFLNKMFTSIFGLNFNKIVELANKKKINNMTDDKNNIIEGLKQEINKKDREISCLRESNEDLRNNYWNLKHGTSLKSFT